VEWGFQVNNPGELVKSHKFIGTQIFADKRRYIFSANYFISRQSVLLTFRISKFCKDFCIGSCPYLLEVIRFLYCFLLISLCSRCPLWLMFLVAALPRCVHPCPKRNFLYNQDRWQSKKLRMPGAQILRHEAYLSWKPRRSSGGNFRWLSMNLSVF